MLCIICGKAATVDSFCDGCFLARNHLFEIKNFSARVCKCGSYYDRAWKTGKNYVEDLVSSRVKTKNRITWKNISYRLAGNKALVKIELSGFIRPCRKLKKEVKEIEIVLARQKCDRCVKISGRYYEAVIQMRGDEAALGKIMNQMNLSNASVEKVKNGYDIRFMDKNEAKKNAERFKAKKTFKLVGFKEGRNLYRSYYLIKR